MKRSMSRDVLTSIMFTFDIVSWFIVFYQWVVPHPAMPGMYADGSGL